MFRKTLRKVDQGECNLSAIDYLTIVAGITCNSHNARVFSKKDLTIQDFMIGGGSNASMEDRAGFIIPVRARHENGSWVVDGECVITVTAWSIAGV